MAATRVENAYAIAKTSWFNGIGSLMSHFMHVFESHPQLTANLAICLPLWLTLRFGR